MEARKKDLANVCELAKKLAEPASYLVGKDWGELLLPREIVCFLRSQQSSDESWGGLARNAKRYDQHHRFVLLVALEGEGRVGVETDIWRFGEGDAVLMFPHQAHYYSHLEDNFHWLFVTFDIPTQFWSQLREFRDSPRRLSGEMVRELGGFLEKWDQSDDTLGAMATACQLGEFLLNLSTQESFQPIGAESELVRAVSDRVRANLKADLSVKALSEHLGVSGSYLREQFREGAGVSLGHFVRSVRLMEATKCLRESSESVREVASDCGFGSFTAFSRAFGQVYGKSPSEYRRLSSS